MDMSTPAPYEEEFRLRLRQATRARRNWVSASEVAGDLCHAAKALKKIADPERRFDGLCDFIFRGGEMLKRVDDSNASLQSVFWDGDVASQLWDATAPLVSDKGKIVRFLLKLYDDGWDRIVFQSVLNWNRFPPAAPIGHDPQRQANKPLARQCRRPQQSTARLFK